MCGVSVVYCCAGSQPLSPLIPANWRELTKVVSPKDSSGAPGFDGSGFSVSQQQAAEPGGMDPSKLAVVIVVPVVALAACAGAVMYVRRRSGRAGKGGKGQLLPRYSEGAPALPPELLNEDGSTAIDMERLRQLVADNEGKWFCIYQAHLNNQLLVI